MDEGYREGFANSGLGEFGLLGPAKQDRRESGRAGECHRSVSLMPSLVRENFSEMFLLKMYEGISHPFLLCTPYPPTPLTWPLASIHLE